MAAACASADSSLRTRKLNRSFRVALSEAQVPCRNRPGRRGVETRELPTKAAPIDPILVAARQRGDARPRGRRRRRRGGVTLGDGAPSAARAARLVAGGGNSRFGRRPRFADPLPRRRRAARSPFRRRDASSFEKPGRASPFLVRTWRGQRHFRWKLRASAVLIRSERRRNGQRRRRPRRRRRAAQGVEDQNKSGDCRARARPLMSPGGNCCARRRATQGDGRPNTTGRTAHNGAVPAWDKVNFRGRVAAWTISCSN